MTAVSPKWTFKLTSAIYLSMLMLNQPGNSLIGLFANGGAV